MVKPDKILIIGPLPKEGNVGGVTSHVERLLQYLDYTNFRYKLINTKKPKKNQILILLECLFNLFKYKIVHIHVSQNILRLGLILTSIFSRTKSILTIHGDLERGNIINNCFEKLSIKYAYIPVVVNKNSLHKAIEINPRSIYISAFIPPINNKPLEPEIYQLLNNVRKSNRIICSTNAFNITYDNQGNETYGINFLIEQFLKLKNYYLIISDPSGNYKKLFSETSIPSNICFINYNHNYFELLKMVDILIRNTSTDGDSLSVREALSLGVTTLCSDVVERPEGCILFKYNDILSFNRAINYKQAKKKEIYIINSAKELVELYQKI